MRRGTTLNDFMHWDPSLFDNIILNNAVNHGVLVSNIMLSCGLQEPVYKDYDTFKSQVHMWFAAHQWNIDKFVNLIKQEYEPLWNYNKFEELDGEKKYTGNKNTTEDRVTAKTGNVTTDTDTDKTVADQYGGIDTTNRTDTFGEVNGRNLTTTSNNTTTNDLQDNTVTQETEQMTGTQTKSVTGFNSDQWLGTEKIDDSRNTTKNGSKNETHTGTVREEGTVAETGNLNKTGSNTREDKTTFGKKLDTTINEDTNRVETYNTQEDRDTTGTEAETSTTTTGEQNHLYGNVGITTYQKMFFEEYDVLDGINIYDWIVNRFTDDLMVGVYI